MSNILILNGSPRAPKSNSKRYAEIFRENCGVETQYYNISAKNHAELCDKFDDFSDVLLVFPLYADAIPVTLLNFLKSLEVMPPENKPTISVLINCGFIEYYQNDIALEMVKLFCKRNGYRFGSVLEIGSGEAILDTPFKGFVERKLKSLAMSIARRSYRSLHTTMPLPKRIFIRASTQYWIDYGKRQNTTAEKMRTMQIEGQSD